MALLTALVLSSIWVVSGQQAPLDFSAQYHIQTDLGQDRFFRFQTHTGQYRKEKSNPDGSQEGTYGWVDPNGVLRLFDYVADHLGYRIEKEYLYKVGAPNPSATIFTRGGELALGFEVYPLDGSPADRQGGVGSHGGVAQRIHLADGQFQSTLPYQVSSLTSTNHHLEPNPLSKHAHATFFSGEPQPAPEVRVVVGAEEPLDLPEPEQDAFVVGHTGRSKASPRAPVQRTGIVIGLRGNDAQVGTSRSAAAHETRPAPRPQSRPARPHTTRPAPASRNVIVIGSSRKRRFARFF